MDITDDKYPQFQVIFGKKYEHRDPENIDAEEYIAKKGYTAKGKKCHQYDLKKVRFIEPLDKAEPEPEPVEEETAPVTEPVNPVNEPVEGGALNGVEGGALNGVEGGALNGVEGPVVRQAHQPDEEPIDIMLDAPIEGLPDIESLPEEGDIIEPTLF